MSQRSRTDLCGGRRATDVPTATLWSAGLTRDHGEIGDGDRGQPLNAPGAVRE